MQLEDHVGDIIRKARQAANASKDAIAKAGDISVAELEQLEDSGSIAKKIDLAAIAPLISLDAQKLQRIADAWLPGKIDTNRWREVRQITTTQRLTVNCYLVWDEVVREAALFDTGWDAAPIIKLVE